MTRTTYLFICDLCGGEFKRSEDASIPNDWQRLIYDHTDQGGHTQTFEKHVCDRCSQRITKSVNLKQGKV